MTGSSEREEQLREEAAEWVARLSGGRTPELERGLAAWCAADPEHRAAYERVQRSYQAAGLLRHSDLARQRSLASKRPAGTRFALAASLAVVAVGSAAVLAPRFFSPPTHAVYLATGPGEVRRLRLADGSAVVLDTASRLQVRISSGQREAVLEQGRARLAIADGAQPFAVDAGSVQVRMNRGVVEVDASGTGSMTVLEGNGIARPVNSRTGSDDNEVPIGSRQHASIDENGEVRVQPAPVAGRWPEGLLEFQSAPLAAVALEANRRAGGHAILIAPDAQALRVTGVFRAGDNLALARSLAAALQLEAIEQPDGAILLQPPRKKNGG